MLKEGQFLTERYRIVGPANKGGMGAVHEGFDIVLGMAVAIKENCVKDPAMRAAFRREAQLLANFRHPSLPRCTDLLEVDGVQYIVMEFIEGDDLAAEMVNARAPLPNKIVAVVAWQMLDVLEYIHAEAVLHRDIKPMNIKLKDGRVYLLDFGLAYGHGRSGEMDTIGAGEFNWEYHSKRYSSLEQSKCQRTSPASELYSLAATLYYLLTNVKPIDAEERFESVSRNERDPLEDVRVYNPAADENISRAVMQALALNADERPQSASEMREMMFPEEVAVPNDGSARRFLTTRLLFEILMLSALAGILFFVPRSSGPDPIDVPSTDAAQASKPTPTPVEPVAEPSPNPAEEVARLAEEAERDWQSGREKEAWSKLERALTLDAKNPHVRRLIADMRWEAIANMGKSGERLSEILGEADSILRLVRSPRSAQEYLARAWANFVKGSDPAHPDQELLGRAIADADKVLTKYDANSVAALTIRASATYMKAGSQLDEQTTGRVLEDFDRAIKLAPMYAQLYANQAEIHFALGRRANAPSRTEHLGLALQGFKKAAELAPRAGFYKDIGDVYFEMQNFEQASYNYGAAINVDSMYYPAHVGLCAAYNNLKQFDRAEQICRQALNLQPNDGRVKQELERALYARAAGDE